MNRVSRFGANCLSAALACMLLLASPLRADDGEPDGAQRAYLSANGLLNRGLYELAAKEYRQFLAEHAEHEKAPLARYGLAVCCFRTNQYADAARELDQLSGRADFVYAAEVWTLLGQCRLVEQNYGGAAKAFGHVLREHRDHALADDASALCAEALYRDGKHAAAARRCAAFVERWPDSPLRGRVDYFWALAEMAGGDYAAAGTRLEQMLARAGEGQFAEHATLLAAECCHRSGGLDQAARWYRRVLEREEGKYTADALLGLATLLHGQGNVDEAGRLLERLLKRSSKSPQAPAARLQLGRVWFDQQRYEQALPLFEQVAQSEGDLVAEATYWAAKCRLRQGAYAEAAERLAHAAKQYPESVLLPEMLYDRIVALVQAEDQAGAAEAIAVFRAGYSEHALAANVLHLAATLAHQQERFDDSQQLCRDFLARYAEHELAPRISFLTAENHYLAGRYGDALKAFTWFERKYPQDEQIPQAAYRIGLALYRLERYDEAAERLAAILERDLQRESFRPALLALGDIHFQRGEWPQAERCLTDYLGQGLDVAAADDALLKLGLTRQRQGQHERALEVYATLCERFSDSPHAAQAVFESGQALVALERLDQARQAFEHVLAEGGESRFAPFAHNHLGAIAMRQQRYAEAAAYFERVARSEVDEALKAEATYQQGQAWLLTERYEEAEKALAGFLRHHGAHVRAPRCRAQLAIAQARRERLAEALETIAEVEKVEVGQLEPELQAALRYEQAWCLRKLGRVDEAATVFRTLIGDGEERLNVYAVLELAEIEAAGKRYEQAAQLLRRLRTAAANGATKVPGEVLPLVLYRLGLCEFELGRTKEAAALLEEFLELSPDSELAGSASFFCGEAYHRDGQYEPAVRHFTRVGEQHVSDPTHAASLLRLGEALAGLQRWARSEKAFADHLERYPDSAQWFQARFGLGWARENQNRYDEAIVAYRAVVERHKGPTAARAQFQIGECLFAKKAHEEAACELLKVDILYAYPEWSAAALYEAGRCFEALGKEVEARKQFKTVVDKYDQTRWAKLASQHLAKLPGGTLPGRTAPVREE
ncbi:MAG: tetratricopeptide repeat protein [Planctomycetes bacterium]|nr:tetratricopeptide repeat protein [Planctomycetota bacterium]